MNKQVNFSNPITFFNNLCTGKHNISHNYAFLYRKCQCYLFCSLFDYRPLKEKCSSTFSPTSRPRTKPMLGCELYTAITQQLLTCELANHCACIVICTKEPCIFLVWPLTRVKKFYVSRRELIQQASTFLIPLRFSSKDRYTQ